MNLVGYLEYLQIKNIENKKSLDYINHEEIGYKIIMKTK